MIYIKRFIDRVSLLESKQSKLINMTHCGVNPNNCIKNIAKIITLNIPENMNIIQKINGMHLYDFIALQEIKNGTQWDGLHKEIMNINPTRLQGHGVR